MSSPDRNEKTRLAAAWRQRAIPLLLIALLAVDVVRVPTAPAQVPAPDAPTLLPGDLLEIEIWREEDLSGEFLVNETGVVVLPMLGPQRVTDVPLSELRDWLVGLYQVRLRNPAITVTPLRRIYVLGEVNEPGLYMVDPTISLAGAVAMAGGTTAAGTLSSIRLVRQDSGSPERVRAETTLDSVDIRSGDQVFVGQRSWFERNSTFVISFMFSVTTLVITLLR